MENSSDIVVERVSGHVRNCDNHLETSDLNEPIHGLVSESKQVRHLVSSDIPDLDENCLVLTTPVSDKGVSINVYKDCVKGFCECVHFIGENVSQLKLCRFAALLFQGNRIPTDDEMLMFNGIVDGFRLVSTEVESFDSENYLSILSEENKSKMDKIVRNEIANGVLEVVSEKSKCIHSLGTVGKPDGGIRPITNCSRPIGKCINDNMGGLTKSFSFKSVDNVVEIMKEKDYVTVVDIKSAYRAVSVDPEHSKLQGIHWEIEGEEKYILDRCLCFGLRCAPFYFFLISEFIYNILSNVYGKCCKLPR